MSSNRSTLLEYLYTTLFPTITTGAGYNFTVGLVHRGIKSSDQLNDTQYPCLFVSSADEERKDVSNGTFDSIISVNIYGFVKASNQKTQIELDKLIEDVTKCLYVDPTQGNKVAWTGVKSILTDEGDDENYAAFRMTVQFQYQGEYVSP